MAGEGEALLRGRAGQPSLPCPRRGGGIVHAAADTGGSAGSGLRAGADEGDYEMDARVWSPRSLLVEAWVIQSPKGVGIAPPATTTLNENLLKGFSFNHASVFTAHMNSFETGVDSVFILRGFWV